MAAHHRGGSRADADAHGVFLFRLGIAVRMAARVERMTTRLGNTLWFVAGFLLASIVWFALAGPEILNGYAH
jgi:hypothetical protein